MKIINNIIVLIISCIFLFACQKEIAEIPTSNLPVFTVNGTIDGDSVSFIAGENTVMITELTKQNRVSFFNGKMVIDGQELEIGIFDGNLDRAKTDLSFIQQLNTLKFSSISSSPLFAISQSSFSYLEQLDKIKWYVDGVFYGDNELEIFRPGVYDICGEFFFLGTGNSYKVCNQLIIGYEKSEVFNLQYYLEPDSTLSTWVSGVENDIQEIKWFNNDEYISNSLSLKTLPNKGVNMIKAEILFKNGSKRIRSIMVQNDFPLESILDFGILENSSVINNDYTLKMRYVKNGITYLSELADNLLNNFKLQSLNYFDFDINGNPIFQVNGKLEAKLKSKMNNKIIDINLNISWGIPIK